MIKCDKTKTKIFILQISTAGKVAGNSNLNFCKGTTK